MPRVLRGGPCVLVRSGEVVAAVDLGLGALVGLLRLGVVHSRIDVLFLTHLHPDHTAELVSFLFAANYDEVPRTANLTIAGGPGLDRFLAAFGELYGAWVEPKRYELKVLELAPGDEVTFGPLRCRAGAVRHIESSLAYRFESFGRSAVISGDTGPSPELETLAQGADVLLVEASLGEGRALPSHLTPRQAGDLARRAGARRLILTHLYPASEAEDPEARAAEAFGGPVQVAWDGMEISV